ncbi:MAG TPA: phosphatidylserine decarboxylase [Pyrinomonadaceae bacterium]|nr:phosphatidylserine decarboxylase [Pyrinomonadaceae bacterium]
MAREGLPYIIIPILLALVPAFFGYWPVALLLFALSAFMAFFFRDPQRTPPDEKDVILSPADGRVTRIDTVDPADPASPTVVSIFLSPLDVHINRAPLAGKITDVTYTKGKFLIATNEEASLVNEQNALTIEGEKVTVVCKQIAGVLARRIVCWKRAGDELALGERFGLIKFSSRTDLILPAGVELRVREGMRVRGGATIIGRVL